MRTYRITLADGETIDVVAERVHVTDYGIVVIYKSVLDDPWKVLASSAWVEVTRLGADD